MKRHSLLARPVAVLMSFLVALVPLGLSGTASATPAPYTPQPSVTPLYTGPLTWTNYTDPIGMPGGGSVLTSVYLPYSLAIDEEDNVYVNKIGTSLGSPSGSIGGGKLEVVSDEGQSFTDITYDAAVTYPIGIAVDEGKNVYVTDNTYSGSSTGMVTNNARILKLNSGANTWTDITYGETLRYAMGIATDHYGNVYAVDSSNTVSGSIPVPAPRILKLSSGMTTWEDITHSAFASLSNVIVFDIVVDGEGNLFIGALPVATGGMPTGGKILKLAVGSGTWIDVSPATSPGAVPLIPYGMGIDKFDNVYAVNYISGSVMKLKYGGDSDDWTELQALPAVPGSIFDVAADSSGFVYGTRMTGGNITTLRASVIYNGNGNTSGTAPLDTNAYKPNETATVAGNGDLQKAGGYVFAGWGTTPGATTVEYAPGATIPMTQSLALYAVWTPPATLTGIALDTDYMLAVGATHQSVVTAVYSDSSTLPLASGVTFSSDNSAIASVNESGLVTAHANGQAVITAEYEGHQDQATVTVRSNSTPVNDDSGIEIIVDGVKQEQLATAKQHKDDGRSVTTVVLDSRKVIDKLNRDNNKLLTIPVTGDSQDVVGQLTGSLVKTMESKEASIQIATDRATYTLPASQVNIDGISSQLGQGVKLEDITVNVKISETSSENKEKVQSAAQGNGAQLIAQPIDFEISASYGSQTVTANKFNSYVERKIVIPDGVDPNKITTGVVLTHNGELYHVPTVIEQKDGKYYASVKSLTNSTYTVIYNPKQMEDVGNHWAKADVNDMNSRLIVSGVTESKFDPDSPITRAEFSAIVTRALGIQDSDFAGAYKDVGAKDWFAGAVQAASNYRLIAGYEDGSFRPNARITREEAAVVLARASSIAKLKPESNADAVKRALSAFSDGEEVSGWARTDVSAAISLDLLKGRGGKLDSKAYLTRAETAALVRRLLQAANLINP